MTEHIHVWKMTKEVTVMFTNIQTFKCPCGEEKEEWIMFGADEPFKSFIKNDK